MASDTYLCVCECVPSAAMVWRKPCRRWGTRTAECVSECAFSGLPGSCTPWGSVCSGRPGVQMHHWAEMVSAVVGHSGRAGGGTPDAGTVPRGWCSSYCSADNGRCAGLRLGWGGLMYVPHRPLPRRCCWRGSC